MEKNVGTKRVGSYLTMGYRTLCYTALYAYYYKFITYTKV